MIPRMANYSQALGYPDVNSSRPVEARSTIPKQQELCIRDEAMLALYSGIRLDNDDMQIGELARCAAVNIQTIRFYERQGLLPRPKRDQSGYRSYDPADHDRLMFIKRNQDLGFTLSEIKQLIDLHRVVAAIPKPLRRKPTELRGIIAIGRERLEVINEKMKSLQSMRRQLLSMLRHLESPVVAACPVSQQGKSPAKCPR